ncbi:ssDNA binding protein-like protein Ssb3 [Pseudovirgaria hyperparasitica]|uniref:SsDNA binding protein-like protein Ssb3 n=1 Tax=Pseudovirgaria hyperparasitica TaxID=470096 RepID=A0A6A6WB74_9PEZI|nr:ssDNA binding protein-like protein Ssb3 [Pseudovirgaria hyperparasitica]KAF2758857.1 ssDNA binding protein-like protein Ssb3 [Pseudovirgaria hyperparasitica]
MSEATPRITAPYLESFSGKVVRITGKVIQLRGENATIDAGGHISISVPKDAHLAKDHAVELVGKVSPDLTVRVLTATDLGMGIDFAAVDAVVDATHRYKEIFYGEESGY